MKATIIALACILFLGCATPKPPVPPPRTEAEMAVWMKRVAKSEQEMADSDYSSNMIFFDE
ncbi:hypothetical protein KAH27_01925 [bacterium]|nr:hypothetical protein [bacterium]